MINKLAQEVHENAKSKGFYDGEKNIGEMLCLIHSEVSEALEADRKKEKNFNRSVWNYKISEMKNPLPDGVFGSMFRSEIKDSFEDELADIMIRVMDLAAFKEIDLEFHIEQKMRYNSTREHKHGKKY